MITMDIVELGDGVELEMVYIPGGSFRMGSPKKEAGRDSRDSYEGPQHKVTLNPFYMGSYPVTQAQYQAVMGENPSYFIGQNRPVEQVSWDDAKSFCQKLSEKTGVTYSLPSESQWEYACRAGTTTPFNCGKTITTEFANYNGSYTYGDGPTGIYRKETTPVGKFPPNKFGLYDMHGNVWEWCLDEWHQDYNGAPTDGSAWVDSNDEIPVDKFIVLRGGSWFSLSAKCRSAYREIHVAIDEYYRHLAGFRIVRVPQDS